MLDHPNVVKIYQLYRQDPFYYYMVLEYLSEGDLLGHIAGMERRSTVGYCRVKCARRPSMSKSRSRSAVHLTSPHIPAPAGLGLGWARLGLREQHTYSSTPR